MTARVSTERCENSVTSTCVLALGHKGWCSRDTPYVTIAELRTNLANAEAKIDRLQRAGRNVTELFYEGIDIAVAVANLQAALDANRLP